MKPELTEHEDFYFNEQGYIVFTAQYLLKRNECCGNGCIHCPYNYINAPEPIKSNLLAANKPTQ